MSGSNESVVGKIFAFVGFIAGLVAGGESGDGAVAFFTALVLAGIGYFVGSVVEWLLIKVLFIAGIVILILIRQAIFGAVIG